MKPDIYRVKQIGSGFLAVMAKPVSGEWIEHEFIGIAAEGLNQIVSLLEPHEEHAVGLQDEQSQTQKNGMSFISFPIPDRGLPSLVGEFSVLTKRLFVQISQGKNTVVHCRAGIGRTGVVAAGILLHDGMGPEQAFELVSEKRGLSVPDTDEQRNWLISNYKVVVDVT